MRQIEGNEAGQGGKGQCRFCCEQQKPRNPAFVWVDGHNSMCASVRGGHACTDGGLQDRQIRGAKGVQADRPFLRSATQRRAHTPLNPAQKMLIDLCQRLLVNGSEKINLVRRV